LAHQYVVENFLLKVDVVRMDVQQNLDALNLDVVLTFLDVVNLEHHRLDVVVDVELRHQLKMDCCPGEVVVELRHQLRMDCCLDVELQVLLLHPVKKLHLPKYLPVVVQHFLREMP
jgi:hypothetical protein